MLVDAVDEFADKYRKLRVVRSRPPRRCHAASRPSARRRSRSCSGSSSVLRLGPSRDWSRVREARLTGRGARALTAGRRACVVTGATRRGGRRRGLICWNPAARIRSSRELRPARPTTAPLRARTAPLRGSSGGGTATVGSTTVGSSGGFLISSAMTTTCYLSFAEAGSATRLVHLQDDIRVGWQTPCNHLHQHLTPSASVSRAPQKGRSSFMSRRSAVRAALDVRRLYVRAIR
jgi:hypothetical protein